MIIQCEQCGARFRLADERVGPDGVRVRCARCEHVFRVQAEQDDLESTRAWSVPPAPAGAPGEDTTREWAPLGASPADASPQGSDGPGDEPGPATPWTGLEVAADSGEADPFGEVDLFGDEGETTPEPPATQAPPSLDPFATLRERGGAEVSLDLGEGLRMPSEEALRAADLFGEADPASGGAPGPGALDDDPFAGLDLDSELDLSIPTAPDPGQVAPEGPPAPKVDPEAVAAWRAFAHTTTGAPLNSRGWPGAGWATRLRPALAAAGNVLFAVALAGAVGAGWWLHERPGSLDPGVLGEDGLETFLARPPEGPACRLASVRGRPYPVRDGAPVVVVRGELTCPPGEEAWPDAVVLLTDVEGRPLARGRAAVGGTMDPEGLWRAAGPEAIAALTASVEASRPGTPGTRVPFLAVFPEIPQERLAGARVHVRVGSPE